MQHVLLPCRALPRLSYASIAWLTRALEATAAPGICATIRGAFQDAPAAGRRSAAGKGQQEQGGGSKLAVEARHGECVGGVHGASAVVRAGGTLRNLRDLVGPGEAVLPQRGI